MLIYLVRHGQTDANVNNLFNGRNERDLNETGISQAEELSSKIAKLPIDLIICSPLRRTVHTAQILNTNNIPLCTDDRLNERDYKELTLKPMDIIKDQSVLYALGSYEEIQGIESFQSIYDRVESFINEIKNTQSNKNILIVTHGDIFFAFQRYFDKDKASKYPNTCELIQYEL